MYTHIWSDADEADDGDECIIKSQNVKSLTGFKILIILHTYFKSLGIVMHLAEMSKTGEFHDVGWRNYKYYG